MGVWEEQESIHSAYSCGCDPGMRREHKNIGYQCKHYPDCTYGRSVNMTVPMTWVEKIDRDIEDRICALTPDGPMVVTANVERNLAAERRKTYPLATGCLDYFPDALMDVAYCSYVGNEQHNPGSPLHWDRSKSKDEPDALLRHLKDRGKRDSDGVRHSAKVAWRSLAMLQKEIENERS